MGLEVQILERESELVAIEEAWDQLAVEASNPYAAPAWVLAWWRHVAPEGAAPRAIAVREGERLLGLAPLWVADGDAPRAHYEVMCARLATPASLLVDPQRAGEVASRLAEAIASIRPRPSLLRFEGSSRAHATVTERMIAAWPGLRPEVQQARSDPMPLVSLDGRDYEEWLAAKRSKFRQEARRRRRRLEEAGASFRLAEPGNVTPAIDAFIDLHGARWAGRGGSTALPPGIREMLTAAADSMLPQGRLRIYLLEREGRIIAVQILVAAGAEVIGWSGGFDEREKGLAPSMQLILHAIADAARRGEARLNLGPGAQHYKDQLADTHDEMDVIKVIPRGAAYARTKLNLAAAKARSETLPRILGGAKRRLARK